jgi:hypothetical protein
MQVSELLGSFGDNELCPECLDGVCQLLRPGGISIPANCTSYLAPVSTHAVHASIKSMGKPENLEVGMVVHLWKHVPLAEPAPVFTFCHPERSACHLQLHLLLTLQDQSRLSFAWHVNCFLNLVCYLMKQHCHLRTKTEA